MKFGSSRCCIQFYVSTEYNVKWEIQKEGERERAREEKKTSNNNENNGKMSAVNEVTADKKMSKLKITCKKCD